MTILLLAGVLCAGTAVNTAELARLAAADYAAPVRPIGENGQVPWNGRSNAFKYPPTFGFTNRADAASYRFEVKDDAGGVWRFDGKSANDSLAPVWAAVPVGWTTVTCTALATDGTALGLVGTRTFWRDAGYCPGAYAVATNRSYAETARLVRRYLMKLPIVRARYLTDKPVPNEMVTHENQIFIAYPGKMGAATISAMCALARTDPASAKEALELAWGAVHYLDSVTESAGCPLAGLPHTYADHPALTKHPRKIVDLNLGKVMMVYPAEASDAYLELYALTKDRSLVDRAVRIMDRYRALQGADGTWALNYFRKDGKPVEQNRLVPVHVMESFEKLYAVTGNPRYRAAAEKALGFLERGPLVTWNWDGQFEDVLPKPPYRDLTGHNATELVLYFMNRWPNDPKRRRAAREMMRFCEDQFAFWSLPDPVRFNSRKADIHFVPWGLDGWFAPSVIEQFDCAMPVDASVARMIRAYLALYRAEGNPLDLAKAKTLGDSLVRQTRDDGYCPTFWVKCLIEDWPDCLMDDGLALDDLARIGPNTAKQK